MLEESDEMGGVLCSPSEPIVITWKSSTVNNRKGIYCYRFRENGSWTLLWKQDRNPGYAFILSDDHKHVLEPLPFLPPGLGWLQHDINTGETETIFLPHREKPGAGRNFTKDHNRWATAVGRKIWYGETHEETKSEGTILIDSKKSISGLAFHPSGRRLAASCNDGTVTFFDTSTWKLVQKFAWNIGRLRCIAFSPDGVLAAAGNDRGRVVVWDLDF